MVYNINFKKSLETENQWPLITLKQQVRTFEKKYYFYSMLN